MTGKKHHQAPIRSDPVTVLMLPDCRAANPYQALLAEALAAQGWQVLFPQGYRRGLPLFRAVLQARSPVAVLHIHWITPYLKGTTRLTFILYCLKFLLDVLLVKGLGVRIIWTIHNQIPHEAAFPQLERWVRRNLARWVDRIILHNRATSDELAREFHFPLEKAVVIPHGHYRTVYRPAVTQAAARQALNLPVTGPIFLNLGLLRPYKGIESLLQVWREHSAQYPDSTLLIAGKANPLYAQKLQDMIADLPNVVLVPEFIATDRLHLFFSAATAVVLPYQKVLNSGSLILAMSYGLPVIAPRQGSLCEYLGEASALLFDPADQQGLLTALQKSLQVDLQHLSQLTAKACDRLDWSDLGKSTSQVYFDVSHR